MLRVSRVRYRQDYGRREGLRGLPIHSDPPLPGVSGIEGRIKR